jgi:antitoxin component YwqK of YwqJK toxin-antitoxin module
LRFAEYQAEDEKLRHGNWKCWYASGQLQAEGNFQYDRESGTFTWWHANGQEAVKGDFVEGQPNGEWTWWHANGQKATVGQYTHGKQVGVWRKWAEDGRLVNQSESQAASLAESNSGVPSDLTQ